MPRFDDLIGKAFKDGGRGPDVYDCWGLVLEVWRRFGVELPDYRISAFEEAVIDSQIRAERPKWIRQEWPAVSAPSMIVIRFRSQAWANHCGVYLGEGRFIHAREKTGAHVDRVENPLWFKRIDGFYLPPGGL